MTDLTELRAAYERVGPGDTATGVRRRADALITALEAENERLRDFGPDATEMELALAEAMIDAEASLLREDALRAERDEAVALLAEARAAISALIPKDGPCPWCEVGGFEPCACEMPWLDRFRRYQPTGEQK